MPISVGSTLATHAAIALIAAVREKRFRDALASRDAIGRAKGMSMERFDTDAEEAFGLLRPLSEKRNVSLNEVALALLEANHPPRR